MDDAFKTGRYLIIDDFDQMRVSFKGMLAGFGAMEIETSPSGELALKHLAKMRFDVVICDYNLGEGKDGQQVLEEARHLGYLGHACTFFMITAESHMPMVLGALEHQPDEYMVKPINRDVFQHRLAGTLQRKKKLRPIDEALSQGDRERAIAYCEEQSGGDLKHRHYLSKLRAELCLDIECYDQAEKIYQELLGIRNFPWATFGLGKIDFLRQDLDRAESCFLDLIEKNQHYLEAYDWAVRAKEAKGQPEQAQQLLQQAVKLAPKSVGRQRKLGLLALRNGDDEAAERAFQAAIRWGKTSCFADPAEYLYLAGIYQQRGQHTKLLQLLAEGTARFDDRPDDQIRMLCKQAATKRELNEKNDIDSYLQKAGRLAREHSAEISAETLLVAAEECYRLAEADSARTLLTTLLENHHDDARQVDQVRQLMRNHDQQAEADRLIESATNKLLTIQTQCAELLNAGETVQAIERLNDTIGQYPANRTLVLSGIRAMIEYMNQHGIDPGYHFRCRQALGRLLEINACDPEANDALGRLSQIPSA
jgi:DNA-binding NarL/FixJ family response regulator